MKAWRQAALPLDKARVYAYLIADHSRRRRCEPRRTNMRSVVMAHKNVERKKELDRRRHRRAERIKARIHEAKAAAKSGK